MANQGGGSGELIQDEFANNTLGAGLAVVASIISIFGTNLQKLSHNEDSALPEGERTHYYKRGRWWAGMLGVVFGAIGDFFALGFATQALVSAVGGATTLIGNVIFASCMNKETLYRSDKIGLTCVIIGAVIFSATTPAAKDYTLTELEEKFYNPGFLL
jgi:drug/metabolite transporter (DMT)-like permease